MPSTTGLRQRKREQSRDAIVSAALRLFGARGFEATSVEQIAEAAGVSHRTFYRYFPSKEDVLFRDPAAEAALRAEMRADRPGASAVERIGRAMLAAMLVSEGRALRVRTVLERTPALRARAFAMIATTAEIIADELLRSAPRGRRDRLRATVLAASVSLAMRAAFFAWVDAGRHGDAWRYCERVLDALREGFERPGER